MIIGVFYDGDSLWSQTLCILSSAEYSGLANKLTLKLLVNASSLENGFSVLKSSISFVVALTYTLLTPLVLVGLAPIKTFFCTVESFLVGSLGFFYRVKKLSMYMCMCRLLFLLPVVDYLTYYRESE